MKMPIEVIFGMVTDMHLMKYHAEKCFRETFCLVAI